MNTLTLEEIQQILAKAERAATWYDSAGETRMSLEARVIQELCLLAEAALTRQDADDGDDRQEEAAA